MGQRGVSYKVEGLPAVGAMAFCPIPTQDFYSSSYGVVHIVGSPGTKVIGAPEIGLRGPGWPGDLSSPGAVAPDAIAPQLYQDRSFLTEDSFLYSPQGTSNELLPVPAVSINAVPNPAQSLGPMMGNRVTAWPRIFSRFRQVGAGSSG